MKYIMLTLLWSAPLWAQWITGFYSAQNGVMPVSEIPWSKYTHIVHFAAAPSASGDGTVSLHYLTQAEIGEMIASRPNGKKVLVCIKDNDSNDKAFEASTSSGTIATFVDNIVNFVNTNGYDGVDLDWEHKVDVGQYEDLLTRLRTAMPAKVIAMDGGNWEGLERVAAASYSALDQINIMCYDMDNGQNCNAHDCAWYNSALFQDGQGDKRTCDWRVRSFTKRGVPAAKIGIGLPFFGRRWVGVTLAQVQGKFATYTVSYRDLVTDGTRWKPQYQFYDSVFRSNYLSIPSLDEFISYTGTQSLQDAAKWRKAEGFGGFMAFTLEYEYLPSATGDARHPLSTALYDQVFGEADPSSQEPPPPMDAPPPRAR